MSVHLVRAPSHTSTLKSTYPFGYQEQGEHEHDQEQHVEDVIEFEAQGVVLRDRSQCAFCLMRIDVTS
jgi:hypothetical protein